MSLYKIVLTGHEGVVSVSDTFIGEVDACSETEALQKYNESGDFESISNKFGEGLRRNKKIAVLKPDDDKIRSLAHQKWQDAGCPNGLDSSFWIRAEAELCNLCGWW